MTAFCLDHIWLVPFYGLLGSLFSILWAMDWFPRHGQRPAVYFNTLMTSLALVQSVFAMGGLQAQPVQWLVVPWLKVADLELTLNLELSAVSLGALSLVSLLVLLTQIYGLGYLEKEWSLARFYGLLGFFEAALSGLALSDSIVLSYGLLEMMTLSTYLLVGFWYAQPLVVTAARDAFLTKRVGDVFLLMGIVVLACIAPGLSFSELSNWAMLKPLPDGPAIFLGLALLAGPISQCAQFPLNLWLDEAMEGPGPASILRNTVVLSAGSYVLIKLQPVLTLSPVLSVVLMVIGSVTAVGASLMALAQIDLKRSLSHSSSAFLGLVFIAVGFQRTDVALLLILAHGTAKARMFMAVGSVSLVTTTQDVTEMGGLGRRMPVTTIAFVLAAIGGSAVLPLGMFCTLQRWVAGSYSSPPWVVALLMLVNLLTTLNGVRLFRLIFCGSSQIKTRRAPEVNWLMVVPMVSLSLVTLLLPLIASNWLLSTVMSVTSILPMALILAFGILGCAIGTALPLARNGARPLNRSLRFVQDLLAYDFYMDKVYAWTFVALVASAARALSWVDRYLVDGAVNLVGLVTVFSGQGLRYSASGQSQLYVATILVGVGALLVAIATSTNLLEQVNAALRMIQVALGSAP
jgi:NAD(P)H-quinone oxidoreductase subunit 5